MRRRPSSPKHFVKSKTSHFANSRRRCRRNSGAALGLISKGYVRLGCQFNRNAKGGVAFREQSVGPIADLGLTRPCPAMMPFAPSIRTGLINPYSRIDPAIRATCAALCVRPWLHNAWMTKLRDKAAFCNCRYCGRSNCSYLQKEAFCSVVDFTLAAIRSGEITQVQRAIRRALLHQTNCRI